MTEKEKEQFEFAVKREQENHKIQFDASRYKEYVTCPPFIKEMNRARLASDIEESKQPTEDEVNIYFGGDDNE